MSLELTLHSWIIFEMFLMVFIKIDDYQICRIKQRAKMFIPNDQILRQISHISHFLTPLLWPPSVYQGALFWKWRKMRNFVTFCICSFVYYAQNSLNNESFECVQSFLETIIQFHCKIFPPAGSLCDCDCPRGEGTQRYDRTDAGSDCGVNQADADKSHTREFWELYFYFYKSGIIKQEEMHSRTLD